MPLWLLSRALIFEPCLRPARLVVFATVAPLRACARRLAAGKDARDMFIAPPDRRTAAHSGGGRGKRRYQALMGLNFNMRLGCVYHPTKYRMIFYS
jgi:hypothetical protein